MFPFGPRSPVGVEAEELSEDDLVFVRQSEGRSHEGSPAAVAGPASSPTSPQPSEPSFSPPREPRESREPSDPRTPLLTVPAGSATAATSAARAGELAAGAKGEPSPGSPRSPRSPRAVLVPSPPDSPTAHSTAAAVAACPSAFTFFSSRVAAAASGSGSPEPKRGGAGPTGRPVGIPLFRWLKSRSLGRGLYVDPARDNFRTMTSLYSSIHPADSVYLSTRTHGAVFNLEYSPDGSVLTVACEQTEVLLFDPISSKHIKTLSEAHEDCVNNIRFLDNRLFATCSDDTTIALWDLRKLNSKVCTLHGHTSWVKNIEYDTNTRLLVTSGFDGNVIIWDTNRCTEDGCPHKKFFHTRFLMRMRLTPDCSKMLISTSSGYLLILHDLDLTKSLEVGSYPILRARRTTSSSDVATSPSSSAPRPSGSPCHHSDSSSLSEKNVSRSSQREGVSPRNSLEVLTPEVPGERDRGNCITSLQLHPKGWATLLRCSSNTDDQEWTCVYEFQEGAPVRPVSPRCSLRLTHYIEEANVGRGYIKELCFSPDGRMISSPHGYGIRLLGFDTQCNELVDCLPQEASPLQEIRSLYSHNDVVLTTKFSPTHCQIASGCLSGRVSLYQPKF
ncbi:DDB1- and CUL4-associated factor 10 [Phascolarctos cinereus]|uniref:DDB1- and CUL4-associated factor 10 n=1 Tax=Phascolarctos cinereus TaxID=38626 RepID=A0A6P5LVD4_PHACI|nr:DDB1- and CUL4-associated factor 10 [Phascolarctos cinereus]